MTGMRLARAISPEVPKPHAFEVAALLSVLERRGLVPKGTVLEEINQLREKAAKAQ